MHYQLFWDRDAEANLTAIWLAARYHQRINEAVLRLEQKLQSHPEDERESRDDEYRIMFASPLAVTYRIYEEDRKVLILGAWRY